MRKRLVINKDGSKEWIPINHIKLKPITNIHGEDLTVNGYIDKYGGIESHVDGNIYTTKHGYMDHLKKNDCIIKDWK